MATVMVEEPPAVTEVGLKLTVVPAGCPPALRLMVCAAPLVTAVLSEVVPVPPGAILKVPGVAPTEKSLGLEPVTVSPTVVVCVALLPVAVTVIV